MLGKWLAQGGSGSASALSYEQVGAWLGKRFVDDVSDKARRERARRRHLFYMASGEAEMEELVSQVFKDPEVRLKRREWVAKAKFNNVLRRIVNEQSVLYSVPAQRTVTSKNEVYQEVQRLCRQHEAFRRINRWLNLHRNLAIGFRTRTETSGEIRPIIDVVSPDNFFAVGHPTDPTKLIAIAIKLGHDGPEVTDLSPHWVVWTDHERLHLDKSGKYIPGSANEHELPRMPWMLASLEPPSGCLLDDTSGEDVVAAHMAVWFQNILLLKESKSATKQPVIAGDTTTMARQQAADSEVPIEMPDGTVVSSVDLSMDLSMFRETARNIYETAAANYGLSPGILHHQGVQSAEARELMRAPLKELRREQEVYFRDLEREFVEVQAMVLEAEWPEKAFKTNGWSIDFGERQTSLDPKTELEVFEHKRRLGLTDTVEEMQRLNPDLTVRQAMDELERHVEVELFRNELMRPLQRISGSLNSNAPASAEDGDDSREGRTSADGSDGPNSDAGLRAIGGQG